MTRGGGGLWVTGDSILEEFVPPPDLQAFRWLRLAACVLLGWTILYIVCLAAPGDSLLQGLLTSTLWLQLIPHLIVLGSWQYCALLQYFTYTKLFDCSDVFNLMPYRVSRHVSGSQALRMVNKFTEYADPLCHHSM